MGISNSKALDKKQLSKEQQLLQQIDKEQQNVKEKYENWVKHLVNNMYLTDVCYRKLTLSRNIHGNVDIFLASILIEIGVILRSRNFLLYWTFSNKDNNNILEIYLNERNNSKQDLFDGLENKDHVKKGSVMLYF